MKDVPAFLQQCQSSGPGQAAIWHRLEELYTKKLWHQLTLQVLDFVQDPCFAQGDGLIKLYENFISEFEHRVNPLSLVEIILHVVRQMTDPNVALTFLEKTREKVKSSDEAVILCKTAIGALKLNIGDLQATKETIEDVEEMLNNLPGVTSVHSLYAFNSGDVDRFQTLKSAWGQQPDLAANEAQLLRKIQLLCLMEMTFTRPANHRQLTFEEIAKSAKINVNKVELLVMKALSVGLVRGSIDEAQDRATKEVHSLLSDKEALVPFCSPLQSILRLRHPHSPPSITKAPDIRSAKLKNQHKQ
ncbi:26S proteasome non-ATPase regulatory subunit 13 [Mastomys coucha]|uniref:26S proteasome non-ATPase regulatory subunit 13 n=1 Tax=Mastomys coucha TaxID=35658 RepID=UPI0012622F72|nr:26S proteasome non-ATPase regulatory subunit 13 [Mastomys coucha]